MRILLDECVPKDLRNSFSDHHCQTVPDAGLAGKKNGEMLTLAEKSGFDVLVTVDKGLLHQQNLSGRKIAIVIIYAKSNKLEDLLQLVPKCLIAFCAIKHGQVVQIV